MWPVIGHEWAAEFLIASVEAGRLFHAYLLLGPARVGKTALARAFAQMLHCGAQQPPCGVCRSCRLVQADRHPDVLMMGPQEGSVKIEAIRELQRFAALTPVEGPRRVCIVSQFDLATPSAANCLLKTLEEPPARVVLLLTADRADVLLPTVVSRCQVLSLRLLPTERIVSALVSHGLEASEAGLIGHLARGRVGWALEVAEDRRLLQQRHQLLAELEELDQGACTRRFAWAEQLSRKPEQVADALDVLASWWRDILIVASGSEAQITNVDRHPQLREWATRYGAATAVRMLHNIRDIAWRLRHNANLRLALEVLMLDMPKSEA